MFGRARTMVPVAVLMSLALAACGETLGPAPRGEVQVSMVRTSGAESAAFFVLADENGTELEGNVSLDVVASIVVNVTSVQVLAPAGDEEDDRSWVTLAVSGENGFELNLLALPVEGDGEPIVLADGELEVGAYDNVRLFFDGAWITFDEDVTFGPRFVEAGTYDLRVPSGEQTGIKVPSAGFVVTEGGETEVELVFEANASVQTVVAVGPPGATWFQVSPVLTARDP